MIKDTFVGEEEFLKLQESFDIKEAVILDMVEFEPPEFTYSLNRVPIGYVKGTRNIYYLDLSKSRRILILGSTGAGKSTLQSEIVDRFMKSGGVVSWFDLKGEFVNKNKPLQDKYANKMIRDSESGKEYPKFLFPSEKPQGFTVNAYRPVFLSEMLKSANSNRKMPNHEKLCQLGISDLTKTDLFLFFEGLMERNARYYELIDLLWDNIVRKRLDTWEKIFSFIDEYEEFDKNAKRLLSRTLKIMRQNKVIGDQYDRPNMIEDIKENKLSILDLKGMLNLQQANSPALMYVNIMFKKIYNAKASGYIPKKIHNMIVISEINKFVPRLGDTPTKNEYLKLLDLVRSERISIMCDTQDWKRIPDTLIEQSDYIFLPYNIDLENLTEIVRKILPQEYDNPHDYKPKLAYWQKHMKKNADGSRDWLLLDRHDKKKAFIIPALPLSHLSEETEDY